MADEPAGTPPPGAPPLPTPEDTQAILQRATQAAERAETAAQRMEAAQQGAAAETRDRFPGMPEELVKQISEATAKATVQAIGKEYDLKAPPAAEPPPAADPPAADPPADDPPPRKSIADRILGY